MFQHPNVSSTETPQDSSVGDSWLAALQKRQSEQQRAFDGVGSLCEATNRPTEASGKRIFHTNDFGAEDGLSMSPTPIKRQRTNLPMDQPIQLKKSSWWQFGGTLQKEVLQQMASQHQQSKEGLAPEGVSSTVTPMNSSHENALGNLLASSTSPSNTRIFNVAGQESCGQYNKQAENISARHPNVSSNAAGSHGFASRTPFAYGQVDQRPQHCSTFQSLPAMSRLSLKGALSTTRPSTDFISQFTSRTSLDDHLRGRNSLLARANKSEQGLSFSSTVTTTDEDDGHTTDDTEDSGEAQLKFRAYQAENWTEKFEDLLEFRNKNGHCLVPNSYDANQPLAQWVKRQRYQYKLKIDNKRSTMSDERVQALNHIGFIWDSHSAIWSERLHELLEYKRVYGDCNVPSRYQPNRQLAVWVKRQRRQYKFYNEDSPSSMTPERIMRLESVGFEWDLRKRTGE